MAKRFAVSIPMFALVMCLGAPSLLAHPCNAPYQTKLFAGKTIDVGWVRVCNDASNIYVTYVLTNGWTMTESHLQLATSLDAIPQKNGNPSPGQFQYQQLHANVTSYTYTIPLAWNAGTVLYIAAHAVVQGGCTSGGTVTTTVVSDTSVTVTRRRTGNVSSWTTVNAPAALAWEPDTNQQCPPVAEPDNSFWDTHLNPSTQKTRLVNSGADWIWDTCRTSGTTGNGDQNDNTVYGSLATFNKSFSISGTPTTAVLDVTCDNGFEAFVNGTSVGLSPTVASGFQSNTNLVESVVHTDGWENVQTYNVLAQVHSGSNDVTIDGVNELQKTGVDGQTDGNNIQNPGACLFALTVDASTGTGGCDGGTETAWGAGQAFPGKNWATYFTYTVQ